MKEIENIMPKKKPYTIFLEGTPEFVKYRDLYVDL